MTKCTVSTVLMCQSVSHLRGYTNVTGGVCTSVHVSFCVYVFFKCVYTTLKVKKKGNSIYQHYVNVTLDR